MGDFHQTGVITTLHRLGTPSLSYVEGELKECTRDRPIALVLPCLHTEIDGPALPRIVERLREVPYLHQVIVSISGTERREEFARARKFFSALPGAVCLWESGPTVGELLRRLRENGLDAGPEGKGRAAWLGIGYALAVGEAEVLAFHDCDVVTYERELLGRLCLPVAHPNLDYEFCKGYYARATSRLHGRVTRLFITPLLRSIQRTLGPLPLVEFLDSFRYLL
ncbi:MAG: glycosyl transferase, partial [Myxococcota bacterium]